MSDVQSQANWRDEIGAASARVDALCELLAAAQCERVSAASIHTMLYPIAQQLGAAAGGMSDAMPGVSR